MSDQSCFFVVFFRRIGLSKLQECWRENSATALYSQPPAESQVSWSTLTDSFGLTKLRCTFSKSFFPPSDFLLHISLRGHKYPDWKGKTEHNSETEVTRPKAPEAKKEKQREDKGGLSEWNKFNKKCIFSCLPSVKKVFTSFRLWMQPHLSTIIEVEVYV